MNDMLEQIGITKDELINRIVDKALGITADYRQTGEESWDEIPLSSVVDKKIEDAIGNLVGAMKPLIQERINSIMMEKIEEVFSKPFQPVNNWNEPKGDPTTIRDLIASEARTYWTAKVDANGRSDGSSYGDKQDRAAFFAKKVMTEYYEKELVSTVKKMAEELKAKIPATISQEIASTVIKHLK